MIVKNVLVPIAKGFEEIELVSIVDILRRANINVVMAGLDSQKHILGAHNIAIEADCALSQLKMEDFDAIALAGGYDGMCNLANDELIKLWLIHFKQNKKLVAAICASPIVLDKAGVLEGDFTCYPGCEEQINMQGKTHVLKAVIKNDKVITSAGPATANVFALSIVKELCGEKSAEELYLQLQMHILKAYL